MPLINMLQLMGTLLIGLALYAGLVQIVLLFTNTMKIYFMNKMRGV